MRFKKERSLIRIQGYKAETKSTEININYKSIIKHNYCLIYK